MVTMRLTFCSGETIELLRVDCSHERGATLTCVRGKTSGAYRGVGTFQWSSAVRGMACLFLQAKLVDDASRFEPMLRGGAKSLAASLDYALTKQPAWIVDMFGVSAGGNSLAKRLCNVTNSHRKRGGDVCVSLNPRVCPPNCVEVVLDGRVVDTPEILRTMLASIEDHESAAAALREEEKRRDVECISPCAKRQLLPNAVAA